MLDLEQIRTSFIIKDYDLSEHAHVERQAEQITTKEIEETILSGEIIESYPSDARGESVLIGSDIGNRSLHVVCGSRGGRILIVTVYEPKLPKWLDYKTRSKQLKDRT